MNAPRFSGSLDLAGIRIDVEVIGGDVDRLSARYSAFMSPALGRDAAVRLRLEVNRSHGVIGQPDGIEYPACLGRLSENRMIEYRRRGLRMEFEPLERRATAFAVPSIESLDPSVDPTPLDTPLRLLLSYLLVQNAGLLVHSSGFGDQRGAILFAGHSGSGKTTTARKIQHTNVLSDDQVALRRIDGLWMAFALPFVGEYARLPLPRLAPLRRILLLKHSISGTHVQSLHPAVATARLLACVPWFVPASEVMTSLLPLTSDLAYSAEIAELAIGRDDSITELIDGLLKCNSI